jgi:hypothetical protein
MPFGVGPTALAGHGTPDFSGTPAALASVGILAQVTGVSALTLTVNGTPWTAESLAGCRLIRVAQVARITVPASSGNASATPALALLGQANEADIAGLAVADRGLSLGRSDVLIVAAVSALPVRIDLNAVSLLY